MEAPPDYYRVLEIDAGATQQEVREAYKKAALQHHPDRVPADSPERTRRTKKFQQINDAYYTLSDPKRRREYDGVRSFSSPSFDDDEDDEVPPAGAGGAQMPGGFPWSAFGFGHKNGPSQDQNQEERFADQQFGDMFEDMMRDEGMAEGQTAQPTGKFWSIVGGLSGAAMGFIVANFAGAAAGAVAGNRLGAIRDSKGKSVYAVFQELPASDKAKLLSELAAKVFAQAVSA